MKIPQNSHFLLDINKLKYLFGDYTLYAERDVDMYITFFCYIIYIFHVYS